MATPQVHLIGKIVGGKGFEYQTLYAKFQFLAGETWKVIDGMESGDTFQSTGQCELIIPLEHPFDINYAASSLRGWPKLSIEVWGIDNDGRNSLAGYGVITLPMQRGEYSLSIPCWRPRPTFSDKIIGSNPELIYKGVLVASDSRFAFATETTGYILIDVGVLTKDFPLHGVQLTTQERNDDS